MLTLIGIKSLKRKIIVYISVKLDDKKLKGVY